jgi:hypothetical protein
VNLDSIDLKVDGDLVIGNGGAAAFLGLTDVSPTIGSGDLYVGEDGPGTLDWGSTAAQDSTLETVVIGDQLDGDGIFILHDPTTSTIGTLAVGKDGSGAFDIFNGADAEVTGDASIGVTEESDGEIALGAGADLEDDPYPNAGSSLLFNSDLYVGESGNGALQVGGDEDTGDGPSVDVTGDLVIGDTDTASGVVVVQGDYVDTSGRTVSSSLSVGGNIYVALDANGSLLALSTGAELEILNTGTVDAITEGAGLVDVAGGADSIGSIDVDTGELDATTLVIGDGGDGALSIYEPSYYFPVIVDPDAPVNSTYTLTLNNTLGGLAFLPGSGLTQTDNAGKTPIVLIGWLAQLNNDLSYLYYHDTGEGFQRIPPSADTVTVSLTRGDGVTVTRVGPSACSTASRVRWRLRCVCPAVQPMWTMAPSHGWRDVVSYPTI